MKNRKKIIVAFLLVAALCIGIGYAALTDTLNINGFGNILASEAANEFDEDIYFTVASGSGCTATLASVDKPDEANIEINDGMGVKGDFVTATFTVKNEGENPATISVAHNSSTNFDISTDKATYTIPKTGEETIIVTITLKNTIYEDIDREQFSLALNVESAG